MSFYIANLDVVIRKKFALFVHPENKERDLAVYLKVYQALIDEVLLFAQEELDEKQLERAISILNKSSSLIKQKKHGNQDPTVFLPAMIYSLFTEIFNTDQKKSLALNLRLQHQLNSLVIKYLGIL